MPNYIDEIAHAIYHHDDPHHNPSSIDLPLYRIYAVLALTSGIKTSSRNVHDAWSAWMAAFNPGHPSLVPFDQLSPVIQALDDRYRDAIRMVAGQRVGMVTLDDGTKLTNTTDAPVRE